jgi:hypothetical protein
MGFAALYPSYDSEISRTVIACDKREAFAHGSDATKQSIPSFHGAMECFSQ